MWPFKKRDPLQDQIETLLEHRHKEEVSSDANLKAEPNPVAREVYVHSVRMEPMETHRVVILKEPHTDLGLMMWISPNDADGIALRLQKMQYVRPFGHDVMIDIVSQLGGVVKLIYINAIINETYYAKIVIEQGGQHRVVDCRPSDAFVVALAADVPIFAAEAVMKQNAVNLGF